MDRLRFTSSQAPNASGYVRAVLEQLSRRLNIPIEFATEGDWQGREAALVRGEMQIGWICGLPYVEYADAPGNELSLLAAPVPAAARYRGRPIYFSDVIVRADSPYRVFTDLRGTVWAFNEPRSHSGYNITCYQLASLGESAEFFGKVLDGGSHEHALKLLLRGRIDGAALDSTVLETELRRRPALAEQIRVITSLGPSPIPPWVVHDSVPEDLRAALQGTLTRLHESEEGFSALAAGALDCFSLVEDADYDPVRKMAKAAEAVKL